MIRFSYLLLLAIAVAATIFSGQALGRTMRFDGLPQGVTVAPAYIEDAIEAKSASGKFIFSSGFMVVGPGTPDVSTIDFTFAGGPFKPLSIGWLPLSFGSSLDLTGFDDTGSPLWHLLVFEGAPMIVPQEQFLDLRRVGTFGAIDRLQIIASNELSGLDNVSLTSAVAEPNTWIMLIVGFAGMGAALRKRHSIILAGNSARPLLADAAASA